METAAWHRHCVSARLFFEHSRNPYALKKESQKLDREQVRTWNIPKSNPAGKPVIPFNVKKLGMRKKKEKSIRHVHELSSIRFRQKQVVICRVDETVMELCQF